ncbi:MAG: S1/P1 nuclease [Candidatus Accumulibacter sp.]|nr:S1/P1 nuclease [Accumulibacter sp.]
MRARLARTARFFFFGSFASLLFFYSFMASAWNAGSHRLVALIAWDRLSPAARREVATLLRAHPDFESWTKRSRGQNLDETAFIEASTWPDDIRGDRRFYSDRAPRSGKAGAPLPGFPDMARHADWHFRNLPFGKSGKNGPSVLPRYVRPGQLDEQLKRLSEDLSPGKGTLARRAFVLPWVIHLVGDAHQPLHAAYRVDRPRLTVGNPFNPRKPISTLHAFWDDLPAPSRLRGKTLRKATDVLTAAYPRSAFRNLSAPPGTWIEESFRIARAKGYPAGLGGGPITKAFFESSREIARRRAALAGYRLALLLNRLLAPKTE